MPEREPKPPKPLIDWESQEATSEDGSVVWWSRLDDRYYIEVRRSPDDGYAGRLLVFDHDQADQVMHDEEVRLRYGARFGPDVDDVDLWQHTVMAVVDGA